MSTKQTYGKELVEFFKFDQKELDQMIEKEESRYYRHSESMAYPQMGAHVDWFSDKPLPFALNDLTEYLLKGYQVKSAESRPLYLKIQLRKPQPLIDADLVELAKQVAVKYEEERYERNVAEQTRQIEFTVSRKVREAEAAAAKAAAKRQANLEADALADLLRAYALAEAQEVAA